MNVIADRFGAPNQSPFESLCRRLSELGQTSGTSPRVKVLLLILISALLIVPATAATFTPLGIPNGAVHSSALAISADGLVAVGASNLRALRWTDGLTEDLGVLPDGGFASAAFDVSADGSVVVGRSSVKRIEPTGYVEGFRWTADVRRMTELTTCCGGSGEPEGVSADGSVVVGTNGLPQAFIWTTTDRRIQLLGALPGDDYSYAHGISADGRFVVGESAPDLPGQWRPRAFIWNASGRSMVPLDSTPGAVVSSAKAISSDGNVVVGQRGANAFRWTAAEGMKDISTLLGSQHSSASAVSADGSIILGTSTFMANGSVVDEVPFIWTQASGTQRLDDRLKGASALEGWKLNSVTDVSDDGHTIVGSGINPAGKQEAWVAKLPRIHVLSAGVNYGPGRGDFGKVDVPLLTDAFRGLSSSIEIDVTPLELTLSDAENQRKLFDAVNEVKSRLLPNDLFILSLSGHGVAYRGKFDPDTSMPYKTNPDAELELPVQQEWFKPVAANDPDYHLYEHTKRVTGQGRVIGRGDEALQLAEVENEAAALTDNELASLFDDPIWRDVDKLFLLGFCYSGGMWGNPRDLDRIADKRWAAIAAAPESNTGQYYSAADVNGRNFLTEALVDALPMMSETDLTDVRQFYEALEYRVLRAADVINRKYTNGNLNPAFEFNSEFSSTLDWQDSPVPFQPVDIQSFAATRFGGVPEPLSICLIVPIATFPLIRSQMMRRPDPSFARPVAKSSC